MNFSNKLRKLRQENSMTQADLAAKLYVTRQAVTKWENGHGIPEMGILVEIAKVFQVSLDYLMDDSKEEYESPIEQEDIQKKHVSPKKIKFIVIGSISTLLFISLGIYLFFLIMNDIQDNAYKNGEYIVGVYLTIDEKKHYENDDFLDQDIPYFIHNYIDEIIPNTRKYFNYLDAAFLSSASEAYLYEIKYQPSTKKLTSYFVEKISKSKNIEQIYEYKSKEQHYFTSKYTIGCEVYFLDSVENLYISVLDKNSAVIEEVVYTLTENGTIYSSKGEELIFLPEQFNINGAVYYYIEYQTDKGETRKYLYTLGDSIMDTKCIVFMQSPQKLIDHDYTISFYFH